MFDCLGAAAGDELVDLFPGSGAVGRAWQRYVGEDLGDACEPGPITPGQPGSAVSVDPGPADSGGSVHLVPATGRPGPGDVSRRTRGLRDGSGSLEVLGDALPSLEDLRDASRSAAAAG